MPLSAALFDVDGTIINGNCTKIFIQYLFEHRLIKQSDIIPFNKKYNFYYTSESDFPDIIIDALRIISKPDIGEFRRHWRQCFQLKVKEMFNSAIINRVRTYQNAGLELFLTSGSHLELVSLIGSELDIGKKNIIATETEISGRHLSPEPIFPICYKEGKKEKVVSLFKSRGIDMKEICFFSDNLSDLELFSLAGEGYWTGNAELYELYSLEKKGIRKVNTTINIGRRQDARKPGMDKQLYDYYSSNRFLIDQSVYEIFPLLCTPDSMNYLVGSINLTWDYLTLQKFFFDPAHDYLNKRKDKVFCLGSTLFLEAAGLEIERYKALIGIGELLDISHEMFIDIINWTSSENIKDLNKSPLDISIVGNVAIALITLASHILISNKVKLSDKKQFQLIENFVSIGFDTLFGNGMELYWKQQNEIHIGSPQYNRIAYLKNKRKLQIPCTFWLVLQPTEPTQSAVAAVNSFVENIAIAIQYRNELISSNEVHKRRGERVTVRYLLQKTNEYKRGAFHALEGLPIKEKYVRLIKSYCTYLMNH